MPALSFCPRCGYDLSGQVATWTERCPLTATCSECGLRFPARTLVDVRFAGPADFFESAPTSRLFRAALVTLRKAARPRPFWLWAGLESRGRPGRMLLLVLAGTLTLHLLVSGAAVALISVTAWVDGRPLGGLGDLSLRIVVPWLGTPYWVEPPDAWMPTTVFLLGFLFLAPLTYRLLPTTLERAKIRPLHLVRILFYSLPWTVFLVDVLAVTRCVPEQVVLACRPFLPRWISGRSLGPPTAASPMESLALWLSDSAERISPMVFHYWTRACVWLIVGWSVLWWWRANQRYLRIERPGLTAVLMCLAAFLAAWLLLAPFPLFVGTLIFRLFTG